MGLVIIGAKSNIDVNNIFEILYYLRPCLLGPTYFDTDFDHLYN